jgi:hypothetical protein
MSWLRVDDRFTSHPKFEGWPVADRWAFLELMTYCARYRTRGRIPTDLSLLPRAVTGKLLRRAIASGWVEDRPDGRWIHDWDVYNPADPTGAVRAKRYRQNRDEHRDADRDATDNGDVTVTDPRARARARDTVPSPERAKALSAASRSEDDVEVGPPLREHERRQAWAERAAAPDVRSPAGFVRAGIASGDWPDPFVADERTERHAVNMPVTVDVCPECGCSPPTHTADCSHGDLT